MKKTEFKIVCFIILAMFVLPSLAFGASANGSSEVPPEYGGEVNEDTPKSSSVINSHDWRFDYLPDSSNGTVLILTAYVGLEEDVIVPAQYYIGELAFEVKAIGSEAFYHNNTIKSVKIEDGVETIRASAFEGCETLEKVEIPASVTWISESAFSGDTNLVIYAPLKSFADKFAGENKILYKSSEETKSFAVEINGGNFKTSLKIMGMGMGGMFIIAISMGLIIHILNVFFDPAKVSDN